MAQEPEGWVHRQEYDEVLDALCAKEGAPAGRSVGITTALRGAGGFGKTALAQKLCFDERVREAYPDGILWATMGEEADSNSRLREIRDLLRWWTEEEPPAFETVAAAGAKLRESLDGARVLVVVDDVWRPDDVAPFQGLGERLRPPYHDPRQPHPSREFEAHQGGRDGFVRSRDLLRGRAPVTLLRRISNPWPPTSENGLSS